VLGCGVGGLVGGVGGGGTEPSDFAVCVTELFTGTRQALEASLCVTWVTGMKNY
jgi:hypothetical protein